MPETIERYRWIIAGMGLMVLTASMGFGRYGYTMLLPSMKEDLQFSYTQMGLIGTGNILGYLTFVLIAGILAGKYGSKKVITVSLSLAGLAMIGTGLSSSFFSIFLFRSMTGIGTSGTYVPMVAFVTAWFHSKERGKAMGIITTGSAVGLMMSATLVSFIISEYGIQSWRYAWFVFGLWAMFVNILSLWLLRDYPSEEHSLTFMEKRSLKANFYRNRTLWLLSVIYCLYSFAYIIYNTFFVAYLTKELGLSEWEAGKIWSMVGILGILGPFICGTLSDKIGRKRSLVVLFVFFSFSLLFATLKTPTYLYMSATLFGITFLGFPTVISITVGEFIGTRLGPSALGFVTLISCVGMATGPTVGGYITDLTGSFLYAFAISLGISILAIVFILFLPPVLKNLS